MRNWLAMSNKHNNTYKVALISKNTIKSILRQTQIEPGFFTLYDIRPTNGVCLFLQSQSTRGAKGKKKGMVLDIALLNDAQ